MKEDNLLNVCASRFINESGLRDVALYGKPKGDWKLRLVDFNSAKQAIFEWYYRGKLITITNSSISVLDDPHMMAFIISKAKEIMKELPNKDIMEEKKTKKMTKAEAFEYLKGKRVVCDNFNCVAIQHKFFEVGVKWRGGSTNVTDDRGKFLFVDLNGCLTHCNSWEWFDRHEYEKISADDILSIEIVDEKYELEFNYDKIVELASPLMRYLNEVECQDSIRVSQYGIVHEPMSTLIFDNGIGE
jgi:hypothetical protein